MTNLELAQQFEALLVTGRDLYAPRLRNTEMRMIVAALRQPPAQTPDGWNALVELARWLMLEGAWEGHDIDGGNLQDKAASLGIIIETQYDPDIHGDSNCGAEPGDQWFVFADWLKPLMQSSLHVASEGETK